MPRNEMEVRFDGPIPGENFTSDTRNYPWHRPPDLTDYDEIIQDVLEKISDEYVLPAIMSTVAAGATIASVVDYLMMSNVGKGRFPIDMAILAAGPVARYIEIMSKDFGVDYEMGLDDEFQPMPLNMVKALREASGETPIEFKKPDTDAPAEEVGIGAAQGAAPEDEQAAMLGYSPEEMNEEAI